MAKVYEMTGQMPDALNVPSMPDELVYIWNHYLDLRLCGDINYTSIKTYSELMCADLQPFEVSLIMDFEREYRRSL